MADFEMRKNWYALLVAILTDESKKMGIEK